MKVTGFSFIRNARIYDYPVTEAIRSVLPVCDEFIVAVGNSVDDTLTLIKNIDPKIRIVETIWDDTLRQGGEVLAKETDKAFHAVSEDTDWCFYIQGDEVVHEKYLDNIRKEMEKWKDDASVDGLLFHYLHFYGSYNYTGISSAWYPKEVRIIKNNKRIYSYRDAQGFRKNQNEKLNVKLIDAYVYHYGWVREPKAMQLKAENFNKLWHDDSWIDKNIIKTEAYDYHQKAEALRLFTDTHPAVMHDRVKARNWDFDHDVTANDLSFKEKFKKFAANNLMLDLSYKNYKLI